MNINKKILSKFIPIFMAAMTIVSSLPLQAFAVIYQPGETLNPACLPTDTNCGVNASFAQNGNAFNSLATLGVTDSNALRFITNNLEALRILANGNIGIGTVNPSTRLVVARSAATSTIFTTAVSTAGLINDENFVSSTLRQYFASTTVTSGLNGITKARLTFNASNAGAVVSGAYIGVAATASSSNPFDFASTPTQITFGGSASTTIASNGAVVSDIISVNIPSGSNIIVSAFTLLGGWKSSALVVGKQGYVLSGSNDSATVHTTGYTIATSTYAISLIETGTDTTIAGAEVFNVNTGGTVNIGSAVDAGILYLNQGAGNSGLIGLAQNGTRMRVTAGQNDTGGPSQGASVDLRSTVAGQTGALELVAGFISAGGIQSATVNTGGTGYVVNDILTVTGGGGTGSAIRVDTASSGAVTAFTIMSAGSGYSVTTGATTTGGTGTGATFNITSVASSTVNGPVNFFSGGVQNAILNSLGNFGIGTIYPNGRLHVSTANSINALVVATSTGSVGIGTNAPDSVLNIVGPSTSAGANALRVLNVIGGAGGINNGAVAGIGGALALTGGIGGSIGNGSLTAGAGGALTFTGGIGGSGNNSYYANRNGGVGGNIILAGGVGGDVGNNGAGGGSSGTGGSIYVVGGLAGAPSGNSGTGAQGNVYLAVSTSGMSIGNVGIRTNTAANTLTIGADGTAAVPVISLGAIADSGTGIFHPTSSALAFSAGGVERLRVTANAPVSIVGQDGSIVGSSTPNALTVAGGNGAFGAGNSSGGDIRFTSGNGGNGNFFSGTQGRGGALMFYGGKGGSWDNTYNASARNGGIGGYTEILAGDGGDAGSGGGGVGATGSGGNVFIAGGAPGINLGVPTIGSVGNVILGVTQSGVVRGNVGIGTSTAPNRLTIGDDGALALPAVAFGGDSNTGIYHPAIGMLSFVTGGIEALRLSNAGRIGLGTTTPISRLHVVGENGSTVGSSTPNALTVAGGNGAFGAGNSPGGDIILTSGNGGGTQYGSNFTLGRGGALVLTGGQGGSGDNTYSVNRNGGIGGYVEIVAGKGGNMGDNTAGGSSTGGGGNVFIAGGAAGDNAGQVGTIGSVGNVILGVTESGIIRGNVGIGTSTPVNALAVNGAVTIVSSIPSATSSALYNQSGTLYWNGSQVSNQWTTSGSNLYYNSGNVAIGSSTPSATARLYIEGSASPASNNFGLNPGNGTVSTVGSDTVIAYNTTGATSFTPPTGVTSVQVVVVAGGGGGGSAIAGGGGAGGYVASTTYAVTAQSYTINVGAGGAGGASGGANNGTNGSNSVFGTITAIGGGGGGASINAGGNGGSGGGSRSATNGTGTVGQGNNGGNIGTGAIGTAGGGGGSFAVGFNAAGSASGAGGNGTSNSITGSAVTYAGGGGGGGYVQGPTTAGAGGTGGGGAGGVNTVGTAGTANTGGGGGGGGYDNVVPTNYAGGNGGSGVVIVRFTTQSTTVQNQALLKVANTGPDVSSTLAFFVTGANQSCIIAGQTGLSCSSDRNLKKDIAATENMLGNVLTLKPVTYNWRNSDEIGKIGFNPYAAGNSAKGENIGFIAQDVEQVFPGLVRLDPNGNRTLAYDKFAPIIVAALQEQYGGIMGVNIASIPDKLTLFSSNSTLDVLAQAGAGAGFISDPISYIRERVGAGIKVVRALVSEKMIAVNGYFKRIFANELCLTDSSNAVVCVTGDQLKNINGSVAKTSSNSVAQTLSNPISFIASGAALQTTNTSSLITSSQNTNSSTTTAIAMATTTQSSNTTIAVNSAATTTAFSKGAVSLTINATTSASMQTTNISSSSITSSQNTSSTQPANTTIIKN